MTSEIKKVKELEVGDIVIFPYCKGPSIVDLIKKIDGGLLRYGVSTEEVNSLGVYFGEEEVTYLGNKNTIRKDLDEDLVVGICDHQYRLSMVHGEYSDFLRSKGYKCEQINGLVYHIHPDYYDQWIKTRSYNGMPTGAVIQF